MTQTILLNESFFFRTKKFAESRIMPRIQATSPQSLSQSRTVANSRPPNPPSRSNSPWRPMATAIAFEAARMLHELGTACWKEGTAADALAKWQKALRYLDVHPVLLDDASPELEPVGTAGARIAFSATSTVLGLLKLSDSDRAKALYQQGLAQLMLKEGKAAEGAFLEVVSPAKEDKAIAAELEHLRQRKKSQREKKKAAYKNFFG
ncbi:hypothetical protein BGW80DRAFT_1557182 [Lactifluus volemus]|nr:hypothetical protein BGW80DRAFT_1557182 [Lactifluus volemus]